MRDIWKKTYNILEGLVVVIVVSLLFAYIRSIMSIGMTEATINTNSQISVNLFGMLIPFVIAPVFEEVLFRKLLPETIEEIFGGIISVLISNLLFAFFHMDIFFLPYLVNGLIYSWYYKKTNSIYIPIAIHSLYNLFVFSLTFLN